MATVIHPDRHSKTGVQLVKNGVVLHTNEGDEVRSPEALDRLVRAPGDRVIEGSSPPRRYGSSYHGRPTPEGTFVRWADAEIGTYSAPPANKNFWHVVIPGFARQTRAEWLDAYSRGYILGVARFIVDCWERDNRSWPLTFVAAPALKAGAKGLTEHDEVSKAWGQTDHWDPGPNFPWDILLSDIETLVSPPAPEEPYVSELIKANDGDVAVFIQTGHVVSWVRDGFEQAAHMFTKNQPAPQSVKLVDRGEFRRLTLVGEAPTPEAYSGHNGPRTYAGDFLRQV